MIPAEAVIRPMGRVSNRIKREVLTRLTPVRWAVDGRHEERRRNWAPFLPPLDPAQAGVVCTLQRDGVLITSLEQLGIPDTDSLRTTLEELVDSLSRVSPSELSPSEASTVRPSLDELLADPTLWQWGLQDRLLDLVENYLGVPARYYGADVRREVSNNETVGVRQWHRDAEDRRTVKILIWLNDVDDDGGPYAYIPLAETLHAVAALRYVAGFVDDAKVASVTSPGAARTATGPKWTAVVADNCRLLHRATPPVARDRYSVTFTWSSRTPLKTEPAPEYSSEHIHRLRRGLTERQLHCLPPSFAV
ncbi:hypothetical protein [Citricoccus sp. GCM10030269]|uniref:hypothetical protein n=1 Tax=Citricoccus sp. GCM10030269 TaxID=3273388 RepID=UPI00360E827F